MRNDPELDDLIGGGEVEQFTLRTAGVHSVIGGVTIPWMMKAFRMGRGKVERKLMGCKPIGTGKHGTPIYDLPDAASYLVQPRVDIESYLSSVKPEQLPEKLRESYWNSMLKRQRWEKNARHLWHSEDVLEVMSEVFQLIRTILQLLPDDIDRAMPLTPEQRATVTAVIDRLQDQIHKSLLDFSKGRSTPSQLSEVGRDEDDDEDLIG